MRDLVQLKFLKPLFNLTGSSSLSERKIVERSGLFDSNWYLSQYPDIDRSGVDPLDHFLTFGGFEGRLPSDKFDTNWYLTTYADVGEAKINPLVHFLLFGEKEGRQPKNPVKPKFGFTVRPIPDVITEKRYGRKENVKSEPMPVSENAKVHELREYFQNKLGWGWGYEAQKVFYFLLAAKKHAAGGALLDAGAGYQRYKPFFEDCIYLAQEHPIAGVQNKGIKEYDILCDCRQIPLADDCVDVILSTSSLEHMEYPIEFFSEAFRVLKPGGALFIHAPFMYEEHETPFDFQRLTRFGLARFYSDAKFTDIEVSPTSSSVDTMRYLVKVALEDECAEGNSQMANACYHLIDALACQLDRGPSPETRMPLGWVAQGTKPQMNESAKQLAKASNKEQFLHQFLKKE